MTLDFGWVLVLVALIIVVGLCFDRWCAHKEIMADKRNANMLVETAPEEDDNARPESAG